MDNRRAAIVELHQAPPPGPYLARQLSAMEPDQPLTEEHWRLLKEVLRDQATEANRGRRLRHFGCY